MPDLNATRWWPASAGAPHSLVVMCHGLGAYGAHWEGFVAGVRPLLRHTLFVAPDGPEEVSGVLPGRRWWDYHNQQPGFAEAGVRAAASAFSHFTGNELRRLGLPASRCALVGFSQGAMTVLHAGPRSHDGPAAVVSIAGRLLAPASLALEIRSLPPMLLIHGTEDREVLVEESISAAEMFRTAGIKATTSLLNGVGHAIEERTTAAALDFLRSSFGCA